MPPNPINTERSSIGDEFGFMEVEASPTSSVSNTATAKTEVNFVSGLLYRFLDWMRGKFGERMTSSQVGNYLDAAFPDGEWTRKELVIDNKRQTDSSQPDDAFELAERKIVYRENTDDKGSMIITDPCHDMPANTPRSQSITATDFSVAECLREICTSHSEGKLTVQIPVMQASRFLGGIRGHFALLNANIENGRVTDAKLVDSKGGLIDTFYDGAAHLMEQFRETTGLKLDTPDNFAIETQYLGDQSLFNDTDCGRFAVAHAEKFAASGEQGYRALGQSDFLDWCRIIELQRKQEAPAEE